MYNDILENQPQFDINVAKLIQQFLDLHKSPICLVAHNGKAFDYPILKTHLNNVQFELSNNLLCIDSLEAFRKLHIDEADHKIATQEDVRKTNINNVPFEFTDGFDDILNNVANEVETYLADNKMKEIQQINETTPKKQIILNSSEPLNANVNAGNKVKFRPSSSTRKRLNYGYKFWYIISMLKLHIYISIGKRSQYTST